MALAPWLVQVLQTRRKAAPLQTGMDLIRNPNADPNASAVDRTPGVADWIEQSSQNVSPLDKSSGTSSLVDRLKSVGGMGNAANNATTEAVNYHNEAGILQAAAEAKAKSQRATEVQNYVNGLKAAAPNINITTGINSSGTGSFSGSTDAKRNAVINDAKKLLGVDYVFGGGHNKFGPSHSDMAHGSKHYGIDCSGLVSYAFHAAGITGLGNLMQTAAGWHAKGRVAPIHSLLPGDIVTRAHGSNVHHVAIYMGGGKIIEAQQTGTKVHIRSIAGEGGWQGVHLNY